MHVTRFPKERFNAYNHTVGFGADDLYLARELCTRYRDQLRAFLRGESVDVGAEMLALQSPRTISTEEFATEIATLSRTMRRRIRLLEIFNTSRCNLTCRHCSAMIPLKGTTPMDGDIVELTASLKALMHLLDNDLPDTVEVMGGEPLLHPDWVGLIEAVRQVIGDRPTLKIVSNGLPLPEATDEQLTRLKKARCGISISVYGPRTTFLHEPVAKTERDDHVRCDECAFHALVVDKVTRTWIHCGTPMTWWGDIYYCGRVAAVDVQLNQTPHALPIIRGLTGDVVNVHDIPSKTALMDFVNRPSCPFERRCAPTRTVPWSMGNGEPTDWVIE